MGGSLGMLLMLMLKHRGVLRAEQVAPVYTFGAPAIFCEGGGACGCSGQGQQQLQQASQQQLQAPQPQQQQEQCAPTPPSPAAEHAQHSHGDCGCSGSSSSSSQSSSQSSQSSSSSSSSRLLTLLGLQDAHVRNVLMHRDIVPRAFACDYSRLSVADWMRTWGPAYKEHSCLGAEGRKHLYFFTGARAGAGAGAADDADAA